MATPSLKFANTFRIAARRGSFKLAAEELFVTASAVSNQIRALETQLGLSLFDRGAHSLQLTEAGACYYQDIDSLFGRLEVVTEQLRARFGKQLVRLAAPPFFTAELLLPRLAELSDAISGIDLQLSTATPPHNEHPGDADVSIIVGNGQWPQLSVARLFQQLFVAAASPQLLRQEPIDSAQDIATRSLLVHSRRPDLWDQWAKLNCIEHLQPRQLIRLDSMTAIVSAAEQGAGCALISQPLAARRFAIGALQRLAGGELTTGEAYYLVARPEDAERVPVRALLGWLRQEFGQQSPI